MLLVVALPASPVDSALAHFRQINSYRMTLHSGHGNSAEVIRYTYKKPGFVRMDFITPHTGALLVYSPISKSVRLRPFAFATSLVITLSPDNSLIKSSHGHRIDASDFGSFLQQVQQLQEHGKTTIEGENNSGEQAAVIVSVEGAKGFILNGVHSYRLWLDKTTMLPFKTLSYDINDTVIEEVLMEELELNPELAADFFQL